MSEQHNIEAFDNLFRESLGQAGTPVPPGVWEGVASATTGGAAATTTSLLSKILGWKGVAIISGAALVTTLVVSNLPNDTEATSPVNSTEAIQQEQPITPSSSDEVVDQNNTPSNTAENSHSTTPSSPQAQQEPASGSQSDIPAANPGSPATPSNQLPPNPVVNGQENHDPSTGDSRNDGQFVGSLTLQASSSRACVGEEVTFSVHAGNQPYTGSVSWTLNGKKLVSNQSNLSLLMSQSGLQRVEAKVSNPAFTAAKTVDVQQISAEFNSTKKNDVVVLTADQMAARHGWYINNEGQSGGMSLEVPVMGRTTLEVVHIADNLNGCSDTVQKIISLRSCDFEVKSEDYNNVITPYLKDGKQDVLEFDMPQVDYFYLSVFSASGEKVFETFNQREQWNGSRSNVGDPLPYGTYTFQLVYSCGDEKKPSMDD